MTFKISTAAANAMLDALGALVANGTVEIRTGSVPANVAAADTGTVVATIALDATPFNAAASASMSKQDTLSDSSADATGTAAHYRVKNSSGVNVMQGTVTGTGGGGDMEVDSTSFNAGQVFNITAWSIGGANWI